VRPDESQLPREGHVLVDWVTGAAVLVGGLLVIGALATWLSRLSETVLEAMLSTPVADLPPVLLGAVTFLVIDLIPLAAAALCTWMASRWRGVRVATVVGSVLFGAVVLGQRFLVVPADTLPALADLTRTVLFVVVLGGFALWLALPSRGKHAARPS